LIIKDFLSNIENLPIIMKKNEYSKFFEVDDNNVNTEDLNNNCKHDFNKLSDADVRKQYKVSPAPNLVEFSKFDVDKFMSDNMVSIAVKYVISILLYVGVFMSFFLIFRYNGYSFFGFCIGGIFTFFVFVIVYTIDVKMYKSLIKKSVKSIKEFIAFGLPGRMFAWRKYLTFDGRGIYSMSSEDSSNIKVDNIMTLEYEFSVNYEFNDNTNIVFCGEYVKCSNNQEYADDIMVVCGRFLRANTHNVSVRVNPEEKGSKYDIFASSIENINNSDIGYVRHIADKVYGFLHVKSKPFMIYFKKGGIEVIYEIQSLANYDSSMLFVENIRKDFKLLGERIDFAKLISKNDYVVQERGDDKITPLPE
jgi:hypothetical protein